MYKNSLLLVGGNRHGEDEPIQVILDYAYKNKIKLLLITDEIHLNKPCKNFRTLREFLKIKKIKFIKKKNLKDYKFYQNFIKNNPGSLFLSIFCFFKIPPKIINLFSNNIYNYHIGLMPGQIGASSSFWQLLTNQKKTGLTFHRVEKEFDTGDIVYEKKIFMRKNEFSLKKYYEIIKKNEKIAFNNFFNAIFKKNLAKVREQKKKDVIYMPKIDTNIHGFIDWSWTGRDIYNFAKIFDKPFSGVSTYLSKKRVRLKNVTFHSSKIKFHPFQSGIIFNKDKHKIYIASIGGFLKAELFFNKKKIDLKKINLGSRLYTDVFFLDRAKKTRSIHTAKKIKFKI